MILIFSVLSPSSNKTLQPEGGTVTFILVAPSKNLHYIVLLLHNALPQRIVVLKLGDWSERSRPSFLLLDSRQLLLIAVVTYVNVIS